VFFLNDNTGYACGVNGIVLKTTDAGLNWTLQNTGTTYGFACIQFVDENYGYASGGFAGGSQLNCKLIKTMNGGANWDNIDVAPGKCAGGSWFISRDTGFVAYAESLYGGSTIVKTTNGGSTWTPVYTGTGWISYFHFIDSKNGYATVNGGKILKTTDGGNNWTTLDLGTNLWGSGIYFWDKNNGIVGGQSSTSYIFKTGNGGSTWNPVISADMIFKIDFGDALNGMALSVDKQGKGYIVKSADAGLNWTTETTPKNNLRGIDYLHTNMAFAVGDSGVILKYSIASDIKLPFSSNHKSVFYNSFSNQIIVEINDPLCFDNTGLSIKSLDGKIVKQLPVTSNYMVFQNELVKGIYLYQLKKSLGNIETGKFIIK